MVTEFFGERQAAAVLKHAILEKYLPVFVGMAGSRSWQGKVAYVDGFAGPGLYDDGSAGSPAVAVDTARALAGLTTARSIDGHLIEKDGASAAALRSFIATEGFDWTVYEGDVEDRLPTALGSLHEREVGFFFLDPFGLGVPMTMLEKIMARSGPVRGGIRSQGAATELLLNFSLPGLRRNAGHLMSPKTDPTYLKSRKTILDRVDASMGGSWWQQIWMNEPPKVREQLILDEYTERLLKIARGGYVWSIDCADRWQGPPSYYLLFVTQHPAGAWQFHQCVSTAMEVYREFCFKDKDRDLFDDLAVREAQWIVEIKNNITELLAAEGAFVVQHKFVEVFGSTMTFARETHVRKAIKALFSEGVTSTNGVGKIPPMRVAPA